MRKNYRSVNNFQNKRQADIIFESIKPKLNRIINEACDNCKKDSEETDDNEISDEVEEKVLNELFGSSSVSKPAKILSLDNSDAENAELFIQWLGYYISSASNNVKKGLENFWEKFGDIIVNAPKMILKGILMLISGAIKGITYGVATIAGIILGAISALIKLINSGIEKAKELLSALYKNLKNGLTSFYNWFKEKYEHAVTESKDKLTTWLGILSGALMAVVNNMKDAAEAMGDFFKGILSDAKEKKNGAVLFVKTWISSKSTAVKNFAIGVKNSAVEAWNKMDKKVRKTYNKIAEKLEEWMTDIKELLSATAEKIKKGAVATKDFAIDKKDKALIWGIQKGVKGLSKNYTEDQVVALVRKCYNESLIPDRYGNYNINEKYFYKSGSHKRMLYEKF